MSSNRLVCCLTAVRLPGDQNVVERRKVQQRRLREVKGRHDGAVWTLHHRDTERQTGRTAVGQTDRSGSDKFAVWWSDWNLSQVKTNQLFLSFLAFKSHDITFYHLEFCLFSLVYITIIRLLINIITFVRCTSQTASRLCWRWHTCWAESPWDTNTENTQLFICWLHSELPHV